MSLPANDRATQPALDAHALRQRRAARRRVRAIVAAILVVICIVVPLLLVPRGVRWWQARRNAAEALARGPEPPPAILFPDRPGEPLTVHRDRWAELGIQISAVNPTPPPRPLVMDGVLYLDPDDYALVRSRFSGEVVEVAEVDDPAGAAGGGSSRRALRFGDDVQKGQTLAVVWSRELGEKKSELAENLSALAFDRETLQRLSRNEGAVPISTVREAERRVRQSEIAVDRIEKTLRSWQLLPTEIEAIRKELSAVERSHSSTPQDDPSAVGQWARVEIHSPIDGTLVEKNVTVGALVDLTTTLFRVANLNHLDVRAFAYEEDLAALQRLEPAARRWTIQLKGDELSPPIAGVFDRIGNLIDPIQHTGLVMGWVDNRERQLRAGQFVTASVALPDTMQLISVPATSVVDSDGHNLLLVESADNEEQFLPVEVKVARFQENDACIEPHALTGSVCLTSNSKVISAGAVEILAEYRAHLRSQAPLSSAPSAATPSATPSAAASSPAAVSTSPPAAPASSALLQPPDGAAGGPGP